MDLSGEYLISAVAVAFICSLVSSVVLIMFGGYGGFLIVKKEIEEVKFENQKLSEKIEREVKARAAARSVDAIRAKSNDERFLEDVIKANEKPPLPHEKEMSEDHLFVARANILKKARGIK